MRKVPDVGASPGLQRRLVQATIVLLGLVAIVGSGGGGSLGFPDLSCLNSGSCPGGGTPLPQAYADLGPGRVTTQVGGTVVFNAKTTVIEPVYRWCRAPAGDNPCAVIVGATDATYTLPAANLGDDGTTFRVTVSGTNGTAWATSRLAVSSMPGVTYQDGEFLDSEWTVTTAALPEGNGATAEVSRAATGGHPGAFRTASYTLPVTPSSVQVVYSGESAVYDPVVQGAIYLIDFSEDCINSGISNLLPYTAPMIEQAGRRFVATQSARYCVATTWTGLGRSSLAAEDFELAGGPACATGEPCPDFSGSAAPIRFGLVSGADLSGGLPPPVQTGHGFDNWKVMVWRR
jgi:hypothetical protein